MSESANSNGPAETVAQVLTPNASCAECVRTGIRCEQCRKWDAVMAKYRPRWERRRKAKAAAAERREQRRQELFASWTPSGVGTNTPPVANKAEPKAEPGKKNWQAGADKSLPVGDRD